MDNLSDYQQTTSFSGRIPARTEAVDTKNRLGGIGAERLCRIGISVKSYCAAISAIVLTISTLNFKTAHAAGFRSSLRVRGKIGIDCHSMIWLFVAHTQILSGGHIGRGDWSRHSENPGSDKFCEIGHAVTCTADYPERTALKSQQKHRPVSAVLSEHIGSQPFKLAQSSQIGVLMAT